MEMIIIDKQTIKTEQQKSTELLITTISINCWLKELSFLISMCWEFDKF